MMSDFSLEIFFTTVGNSGNTDGNCVALLLEPIVRYRGDKQMMNSYQLHHKTTYHFISNVIDLRFTALRFQFIFTILTEKKTEFS